MVDDQYVIFNFVFPAQASTGKQGVLGPTKIYLAVQPSSADSVSDKSSQPPPLAPVQTQSAVVQNQPQIAAPQPAPTLSTSTIQSGTPTQQVCNMSQFKTKPKVIVQRVNPVYMYTY